MAVLSSASGIGKTVNVGPGIVPPVGTATKGRAAGDPPPRVAGRLHLWSPEAALTVTAEQGKRAKVLTERAGGWRVVPRGGETGATTHDGSSPLRIQLNLIFDGYNLRHRVSVQGAIDALRLLGYRDQKLARTPEVHVIGSAPYTRGLLKAREEVRTPWVIEALDIDEVHQLEGSDDCCYATAAVTLLEHVEMRAEREQLKASGGVIKYAWKKGDTLAAVALELLGDEVRDEWIRDANPKLTRAGWSKVKAGTIVLVPRRVVPK